MDRCAALLKEMNATIVRGPMQGSWALFEDPDGIRLEVNLVPDAGLLAALWSDPDLTRTMEV